jgi:hypothetical protein
MTTATATRNLDRLLDPVTESLTPEAAARLVSLKADPDFQERLDLLADKCTEGTLTDDELREYDACVHAITLIGLLHAKARRVLRGERP